MCPRCVRIQVWNLKASPWQHQPIMWTISAFSSRVFTLQHTWTYLFQLNISKKKDFLRNWRNSMVGTQTTKIFISVHVKNKQAWLVYECAVDSRRQQWSHVANHKRHRHVLQHALENEISVKRYLGRGSVKCIQQWAQEKREQSLNGRCDTKGRDDDYA